jgi:hypothetical protein
VRHRSVVAHLFFAEPSGRQPTLGRAVHNFSRADAHEMIDSRIVRNGAVSADAFVALGDLHARHVPAAEQGNNSVSGLTERPQRKR